MSLTPYLSDAEIRDIVAPLKQPAAIVRWFKGVGFITKTKPNGMPLIARAHFDSELSRQAQPNAANNDDGTQSGPNVVAFLERFSKGAPRGQKTQEQSARSS